MAGTKSTDTRPRDGIQVATDEIIAQVATLADAVDQIGELVASARRLAERTPKLGTAPPAVRLATRLRDAAGQSGLSGEVSAADAELDSFHRALRTTADRYREGDRDVAWTLGNTDDGTAHDRR